MKQRLTKLKIWLKKELDDDNDGNQSDDFDLFGKRRKRDIEDLFSFESENESLQQEDRERLKDVLYLWLETRLGSARENETGTEKMERKMKLALLKILVKKELDDDNEDNESDEIDFFVKSPWWIWKSLLFKYADKLKWTKNTVIKEVIKAIIVIKIRSAIISNELVKITSVLSLTKPFNFSISPKLSATCCICWKKPISKARNNNKFLKWFSDKLTLNKSVFDNFKMGFFSS